MNPERMFVDNLVQITNVTPTGPDDVYGDPTDQTFTFVVPGAYFPGPTDDLPDRPDGNIDATVFVAADVPVAATSRVTIAAAGLYDAEVVGRPRRWHSPRTAAVEFIQLALAAT